MSLLRYLKRKDGLPGSKGLSIQRSPYSRQLHYGCPGKQVIIVIFKCGDNNSWVKLNNEKKTQRTIEMLQ